MLFPSIFTLVFIVYLIKFFLLQPTEEIFFSEKRIKTLVKNFYTDTFRMEYLKKIAIE